MLFETFLFAQEAPHQVSRGTAFVPLILIFGLVWFFVVRPAIKERKREIICPNPNCGHKGRPIIKHKGSLLVGLLLLFLGVIPGLLYFIFYHKKYYICPKCGVKIREE